MYIYSISGSRFFTRDLITVAQPHSHAQNNATRRMYSGKLFIVFLWSPSDFVKACRMRVFELIAIVPENEPLDHHLLPPYAPANQRM